MSELGWNNLRRRERELLDLLMLGLSNKEIAARMGLAEGTIKFYVSRILCATGANNRVHLAMEWRCHGCERRGEKEEK